MKIYLRNIFVVFSLFTFALFAGNGFLIGRVHAQTFDKAINTKNTVAKSEFKNDVERGIQEVSGDMNAQNNQREIENDDSEHAGDEHGDVREVEGENSQSQIDNEIEQEVDKEDAVSGHSSDRENVNASTSTENDSSFSGMDN